MVEHCLYTAKKGWHAKEILRWLSQAYPRTLALLIGIVLSTILLLSAEGVFWLLNRYKDIPIVYEGGYPGAFLQYDALLGYKPRPNTQVLSRKKINDEIVYRVDYSTGPYGRRITPIQHQQQRTQFLLVFGCSFVFGQGVHATQTLPFYLSQFMPDYRPYNYGVPGYGPHQMLAKLQSGDLNQEIQETQGIAIYLYRWSHIARAIGQMHVYNGWGYDTPFYTLDAQGELVRKGSFTSGRPLLSFFYSAIGKTQMAEYYNIDFPPKIAEHNIYLTARIIEEARNVFVSQFGTDRFYVVLYPGLQHAKRISAHLQHARIKYLDYSTLFDPDDDRFRLHVYDGHGTADAYRTIATALAKDVGLVTR